MSPVKKPTWFIPEEFPNGHLLIVAPVARAWIGGYEKYGAGDFMKNFYTEFENYYTRMGWVAEELNSASTYITEKTIENPAWAEKLNKRCVKFSKKAEQLAKRILRTNISVMSTSEIIKRFRRLYVFQREQHVVGTITSWTNDAVHEHFSNHLRGVLAHAIERTGARVGQAEAFSILTTPTKGTFATQEELGLINLAREFKKISRARKLLLKAKNLSAIDAKLKKENPALWRRTHQFWFNYCWLVYIYMGPPNTKEYYYSVIQSMLKQKMNLNQMERVIRNRQTVTSQERTELLGKLKFEPEERRLLALGRDIVWLKAYRKDILGLIFYGHEHLLRELGKRYHLTSKQLWMCFPKEISERFLSQPDAAHILNERVKHCLLFYKNKKERLYTGDEVKRVLSTLRYEQEVPDNIEEVVGSCAYAGHARGTVKIINTPEDMAKMKKGNILVSHATTPNIVPAMKLARAIVTNAGGLTCHAAIVSRELKIPCVVGTKIATKVFKDGDRVEVDANEGVIRKL